MRRWLRLLDQAITPAMLRRAFTVRQIPKSPRLSSLLHSQERHQRRKSRQNRPGCDISFRHPRVPGQWERRGFGLDGSLPLSPFEIALIEILADTDVPSLSEEHVQLLRRFDPLQEDAQNCRDLNSLLESEIITKVRELKQSLDSSFYHPGVLATIAPYNVAFGRRFDEFFHAAAAEIREFASPCRTRGHDPRQCRRRRCHRRARAALEESELLKIDYSTALDKFRRVSKLKQALERRPPIRRMSYFAGVRTPAPSRVRRPTLQRCSRASAAPGGRCEAVRSAVTPQQISTEETKIRQVEESIRVFVRVADPKFVKSFPCGSQPHADRL